MRIACHLPANNLYDEGFGFVLDQLQNRASVGTLFLNAFGDRFPTRLASQEALADHGHPRRSRDQPCNQIWFEPPAELLADLDLDLLVDPDPSSVDFGGCDVYADLAEYRYARGVEVHARILEYALASIDGWQRFCEMDYTGNRTPLPCWRHPEYRAFWSGLTAHLVANYDLDGIHFGAERNGPLTQSLLWSGRVRAGCFCEYCLAAAGERRIDPARARDGFRALDALVRGAETLESFPLRLMRLYTHYPEVLAWERLWTEGRNQAYAGIRDAVHRVKREAKAGWHLWQYTCSLDLIARASTDYQEWATFSDYVKPCLYQDVAASRAEGVTGAAYGNRLFRGFPESLIHEYVNRCVGQQQAALTGPFEGSFGPAYAGNQSAIIRDELNRSGHPCELWCGIGVNVQGKHDPAAPQLVRDSVEAAISHGADGIVLCREYQEMTFEALDAVGKAVQRCGLPEQEASL